MKLEGILVGVSVGILVGIFVGFSVGVLVGPPWTPLRSCWGIMRFIGFPPHDLLVRLSSEEEKQ